MAWRVGKANVWRHRAATHVQPAIRAAFAGSLSALAAQALHLSLPLISFITAVMATDLDPARCRKLGIQRLVATALGALTGAMIGYFLGSGLVLLGCSVVIAMLLQGMIGLPEAAKVAGYTAGLIVIIPANNHWMNALDRFFETAIGVGIAWAISYIPKLLDVEEQPPC